MSDHVYDVVIIGNGPAGCSAAIYAGRASLNALRIEMGFPGGQVLNTSEVDNYPGLPEKGGMELADAFYEHSAKYGLEEKMEQALRIENADAPVKTVVTDGGSYQTKTVLVAAGAHHRVLGAEGEDVFTGRGVSYCATCDGGFYHGKTCLVIGGGDTAISDALYLSHICEHVYLAVRRGELRATGLYAKAAMAAENLTILWHTEVKKIYGDKKVSGVSLINNQTGETSELALDGVFVAVGISPSNDLLKDLVKLDEGGFVYTDDYMETSVPGIFAAGDVRVKTLRQIVTAASDGAVAITGIQKYLNS
ncbi:MAG: thioredoxin-disulfide reductase [Firmicutes bacterium]|nr:thioredoxin-disulfide reductase [Bacillota bacterium]